MALAQSAVILGIEASCDDTAAAVLHYNAEQGTRNILSNVIHDQSALHTPYGGVVPEIAARAHAEKLDSTIEEAMARASLSFDALDALAVTQGPGLIGGLIAGVASAQGIGVATGLPVIGVNHLEGHVLTPRLTDGIEFPYLALLVSGGHCQFIIAHGQGNYERIGTTLDDAPGEAFDKVAKLLSLGYPGGPKVEEAAKEGDPKRFNFPRPLKKRDSCDLSFSGLKTAVRLAVQENRNQIPIADIAASFQAACADSLADKSRRAIEHFRKEHPNARGKLAVVGGVAANQTLRAALMGVCEREGFDFFAPPLALCTDNAAMIAWVGIEKLGSHRDEPLSPRPRMPLAKNVSEKLWSGKRGPKV